MAMGGNRRGRLAALLAAATLAAGCGGGGGSPTSAAGPTAPTAGETTTAAAAPAPIEPLTGTPPVAPAGRPALSVKVDNVDAARPQSGLNQADLVVEALVEGGQTRLFAVFRSQSSPKAGPIRSARPVDAELLAELRGGIFAYSGAAPGEIAPVEERSGATLLSQDAGVGAFHRDSSRPAPHNVYASTDDLYAAGAEAGDRSPPPSPLFAYGPLTGGSPAGRVDLVMGERTTAAWTFDTGLGQYVREQNGTPDVLDDGSPITADDVLIRSVDVSGSGTFDVLGEEDPYVQVVGRGAFWLLRDGVVIAGTWSRPTIESPTTYTAEGGSPLLLRPGRTWVELLTAPAQPSIS